MNRRAFTALWLALGVWPVGGEARAAEVWRRVVDRDLVFFDCISEICGKGATISCQIAGPKTDLTLDRFAGISADQWAALRDSGRAVEPGKIRRTVHGGRVLFQSDYVVLGPGQRPAEYFRSGFLLGEKETFVVASSSTRAATAERNFDGFVVKLLGRPVAESVAECLP